MKRGMILFSMVAMLAVSARCQTAMLALDDIPGTTLVCVTNYGPQVVSLTARVTGLEWSTNDWSKTVSNLAALSNNVSALSSRVTATNALFSAWFAGLQSRTSYWDTAYSWGDWSVAVGANTAAIAVLQTNTVTRAGTNGFVTASITNGLASTSYVAAAVAAIPAADAFWPPNATASIWFTFTTNSGAITITGYNIAGGTDVVIPDYINGFPVTGIGADSFWGVGVTSIGGAGNVVTAGDYAFNGCTTLTSISLPQVQTVEAGAFYYCTSLVSVSLPQAQTVGGSAFYYCTSLTSISLPQVQTVGGSVFAYCGSLTSVYFDSHAPTIGAGIFADITPNQVTIYVTNPTATGWGATLGGMPVVRPPLYADAIYQAGELVATTGYVAQASLADTKGIYNKVETYNVLTDPAETEIVLVEGKSVYDVNVYTNAVIKFNAEGLNFTEKEAEFKLVLHITETNIPSLTFAEGIQFAQTPEYTVTGNYENVVSTRDGTNYLIRQTYPTVYQWIKGTIGVGAASVQFVSLLNVAITYPNTNWFSISIPTYYPTIVRTGAYGGAAANGVFIGFASGDFYKVPNEFNILEPKMYNEKASNWTLKYVYFDGDNSRVVGRYLGIYQESQSLNANVPLIEYKQANELEIKAYSQGWRP